MKGIFQIFTRRPSNTRFGIFLVVCLLTARPLSNGAPLTSARVSAVIHDVRLLPSNAAPRPAAVNDNVGQGTAVRTGTESRAELTFADLTVTRLGENTIFSFNQRARELNVTKGAILLEVPSKAPPAKINTAAVTAAVMGGTALFATGPPVKFMVLEGTGTFYPAGHPERAVTVHAGEMVMMTADGHITQPTKFNVQLVLKTSQLIVDFPDLANLPLILDVVNQQLAEESAGTLNPLPSKNPLDVIDVLTQNATANPAVVAFTAPPTPAPTGTPSEFGPSSTITSPNPYVITSGTTITTDPTITTNGRTDFGKIYRGPALDGSEFDYLFGSTSSFDTTIMNFFNGNGNFVPVAVFKFSNLELAGNPTIVIPSGAATKLGFVSVGDITSGPPGGTLTFNGIERVFFATQDGSINLDSNIAFSGISHLTFYARGSGSNLTLASPISGGDVVHLDAEGTVQINGDITASTEFRSFSGGDFLAGSGRITAQNIDIESLSNINIDSRQFPNPTGDFNVNAAGTLNATLHPGYGGTTHFSGTSLTAQGNTINLQGTVNPTTFDLGTAIVSFTAGNGGIQAPGILFANGSSLLLQTTNGGDINIYGVETPSNDQGGNISSGTIDAAGAVTATASITNVKDLTAGTSISVGGDLGADNIIAGTTINVGGNLAATTLSAGGNINANSLLAQIDNTGGSIGGNATISVGASGNINTGDATIQILNSDNGSGGSPGRIGGKASIGVTTGGDFTGSSLTAFINDRHGGAIGSAATLALTIGGALSITNDASVGISTRNDGTGGGTIGSNATVDISAASVSVGGGFTTFVSTAGGGSITGSATNRVNATGDLIVQGPILVEIEDPGFNQINPINFIAGGHIGGDATVTLSAQNITTSSTASGIPGQDIMALEASIYPNGSGTIGGNAIVNVLASQNISAPGTVFFTVANGNFMETGGGTIGGDAQVNVSASNLSTGALFDDIYNYGGASIGRDAIISLNVSNSFTATGNAEFAIFSSGGTVTRDASINVTARDISAPSVTAEIDNSSAGRIGSTAAIDFNVSGNGTIANDATFEILGSDGASSGAAIIFNGGNYRVGGSFLATIDGDGAITFNNASVRADVVKVGVFGNNGTLTIGGGVISANTLLKLYAPGSNGTLNFVGNVTLSSGTAANLAANTITIQPSVLVTIAGNGGPANVYTNNPNYSGFGGSNPANGTFGGNGANRPQSLANAPLFSDPPTSTPRGGTGAPTKTLLSANVASSSKVNGGLGGAWQKSGERAVPNGKATGARINVGSSAQLLSMLDAAAPGPGGKITIPASKSASNSNNSNRRNADGRLKADRGTVDTRHARDRADNPPALASARSFAR